VVPAQWRFCISCVRVVENPTAGFTGFRGSLPLFGKISMVRRGETALFTRRFSGDDSGDDGRKLRKLFFLNCTKNTELTNVALARTFSLARTKKTQTETIRAGRRGWSSERLAASAKNRRPKIVTTESKKGARVSAT